MCGIVGYVGQRNAVPILLDGLKRLEYRGYDSAGLAVVASDETLHLHRAKGKLHNLEDQVRGLPLAGHCGIGHTRWATHGRPTEENAHPHRDMKDNIVVVHNGVIENYLQLKQELRNEGVAFRSDTDTEVIAHLIARYFEGDLEKAARRAMARMQGLYAIVALAVGDPGRLVAARSGPPVVIGIGDQEYFVASDVPAILQHTRDVIFLNDGDFAVITGEGVNLSDFEGAPTQRRPQRVTWDPIMAEKGGFKHFMLKEIFEQPRAVRDTVLGRVEQGAGKVFIDEIELDDARIRGLQQLRIVACGTSWHAALCGKWMIEQLARIPVDVDYGSEFRYRDPIIPANSLTVVISQSGETADTLAGLREAKAQGSLTLGICNVPGSMITREADGTLLTNAGPEIGVASTKAFTSQLTALYLLALRLGQGRGLLDEERSRDLVHELLLLPGKLEHLLQREAAAFGELPRQLSRARDFLYLGRGVHFPIALEGALKLKEISYIHAEGYPAGEMKHGPNALIDEELPVVVLATHDPRDLQSRVRYEKTLSNIQEAKARGALVLALAIEGDEEIRHHTPHVIEVPPANELLLPILEVVPLQLLAYHVAVILGCDVDQPRNLAKSVTVE
jgi:glucosamine--fructose-6-phosphate aminotransferase (isomerizing)